MKESRCNNLWFPGPHNSPGKKKRLTHYSNVVSAIIEVRKGAKVDRGGNVHETEEQQFGWGGGEGRHEASDFQAERQVWAKS